MASPPFEVLQEYLRHHGLTEAQFASLASMDPATVSRLFVGSVPIDDVAATAFERVFGRSKVFWLRLQHNFDEGTVPPFLADWRSPPGETMIDLLTYKGITLKAFGQALRLTEIEIDRLIDGTDPITPRLAADLAAILGATPSFWLKRDADYRR